MNRTLRIIVSVLLAVAIPMLALAVPTLPAAGTPATAGTGRFTDAIEWMQWGEAGTAIPNAGLTRTETRTVAGQALVTSCTIGTITSSQGRSPAIEAYSPGSFRLDTFDDLYNSGAAGAANTLDVALATATGGDNVAFPVSCSATLGGTAVPLGGLVIADAESTNANESFGATIAPAGTWRIIDRASLTNCTNQVSATRTTANQLTFSVPSGECGSSAIAFADGVSSATVTMRGSGLAAVAIGVVLPADRADAPASYGDAGHLERFPFTGGTLPADVATNISSTAFPLATVSQPTPRLGDLVDPDEPWNPNVAATGDDAVGDAVFGGPDDEEAVTVSTSIPASPGTAYAQVVRCAGSGAVAGWLDWNGDGDFSDTAERAAGTPTCDGTSATLNWTVPVGVVGGTSYLRVRTATSAADVANATGAAEDGEVEDHAVDILGGQSPLGCSSVYAVQGASPRNVWRVDPATGALATSGSAFGSRAGVADTAAINALGITAGGDRVFGTVVSSADASVRYVYEIDRTAGTTTRVGQVTVPTGTLANVLMGAVNPRTGIYYFGGLNGTTLVLYGYDTIAGTVLGQVASGTIAAPGTNGDLAFDNQNHLYVVASATTSAALSSINQQLPMTAGTPITLTGKRITTISDPSSTTTLAVGVAAGGQGDRRLYLASPSQVRTVNPSTGAVENVVAFSGAATTGVNDLASCASPNTITAQASFPDGRVAPGDQATVTITGGGITGGNSGTTAGTDTGVQSGPGETAGPVFGLDATTYTATQTGITTADYQTTYLCTDVNTGAPLSSGTGRVATFTMPGDAGADGTAASCLFTNTVLAPAINLDKQAGTPTGAVPGATVPYHFVVTNTGNVALSSVSVADPKIGTVTCAAGSLAIGASRTCTGTYTLTQADVNAGQVVNTATATGVSAVTGLSAPNATASDTDTLTITRTPSVSLVKNATPDPGADSRLNAGDTITYAFTATNTGNVTLTGVGVTDARLGAVTCAAATLGAGASTTCTAGAYTVTQADVNAGTVDNTATVSGTPPTGPAVSASATRSTPTSTLKAISLDKVASTPADTNSNGLVDAGDRITYTFAVRNTGDVTLTAVAVTDPRVTGLSCPQTTLAPRAATTCTAAIYVITQADVDTGAVTNTASVSGTPPTGAPTTASDTNAVATSPTGSLSLTKTAGTPAGTDGRVNAGDTIAYSFLVRNTGTVTLSALVVTDAKVGTVTCPVTTLAPGATTTCTAGYTITQADVNAGTVANSAVAAAGMPAGTRVSSAASTTATPTSTLRSITLNKEVGQTTDVNANGRLDAGDSIGYTFLVTNAGDQTLTSVGVNDARAPATCPVGTLAPGASTTCTASYTITQTDVNSGAVNNSATARGTPPTGTAISSALDTTSTPTSTLSTLALTKSAAAPTDVNANSRVDAGDTVAYSFLIANTGAQTLSALGVTDAKVGAVTCSPTTLAPGASITCTQGYTITQADVDGGSVANTATASGRNPGSTAVTSNPSSTSTSTATDATLTVSKSAGTPVEGNANGRVDAGDTITYSFLITNTGAVTLDAVVVNDAKVGPVTCPATTLSPGDSVTCSQAYVITQADTDTGTVANTATASGNPPGGGTVTSSPSSTSTPTSTIRSIELLKQASAPADANSNARIDAGDVIAYSFLVTNTGAQTLSGVRIDDAKVGVVTCPTTPLRPGGTLTCTTSYPITQAEVNAGAVNNTATASGTPPTGTAVTSADSTTSTATSTLARLSLDKQAGAPLDVDADGRIDAGDTISYAFVITNTGAQSLSAVGVNDAKIGSVTCTPRTLAPGASVTCTKPYAITGADVNAGAVTNTATASGTPPTGAAVTSDADTTSTPTSPMPAVTVDLAATPGDANANGITDAGDTIAYTYTVTNTGAVTLTDLGVVSALGLTVTCPTALLAAGASLTCTSAAYTITQADVDAGSVDNAVTATGTPPTGSDVSDDDEVSTPTDGARALTIDVQVDSSADLNADGRLGAGDTITYAYVVTNDGSVTLSGLTVDDGLPGTVVCPGGPLPPGASVTCTLTYSVTPADVLAGSVTNAATATGSPPSGPAVTSAPDSVITTMGSPSAVTVDITAGTPSDVNANGVADAGDTVVYRYLVTNTGTVGLSALTLSDSLGLVITCPASTLPAGARLTCTSAPYPITRADMDAGAVANTARVTGTPPSGADVTDDDGVSTPTAPPPGAPGVVVDKTAAAPVDVDDNGRIDAGDTIAYSFQVTNTGGVALTGVAVQDPLVSAVACPSTTLAVGASQTCSATYTITATDVAAGTVNNAATVTATPPTGPPITSPQDTTASPIARAGRSIALEKRVATLADVDEDGRTGEGDQIIYEFVLTNTGTARLTQVKVSDPMLSEAGIGVSCPGTVLEAGAEMICRSQRYAVTEADESAGEIVNVATASAIGADGAVVNGNRDQAVLGIRKSTGVESAVDSATATAPASGDGVLPNTGNEVRVWMPLIGMVMVGAGVVLVTRRRRRDEVDAQA